MTTPACPEPVEGLHPPLVCARHITNVARINLMLRKLIPLFALCLTLASPASAGVTIHYEGTATSPDAVGKILAAVTAVAQKNHWKIEGASVARGKLRRVIEEKNKDYEGRISGVVVRVSDNCEPLYFRFGDDLFMQDYVKTQFAGVDAHIQIVELLKSLRPHFRKLEILDEGDFWDTHDRAVLAGHMAKINSLIEEEKQKNPRARGPVRLDSGRIADIIQ